MKMTREKKEVMVEALATRLRSARHLYLTDFTGVAVKPMTEFRRKLRDEGIEYVVVKNTLAARALEAASVGGIEELLEGPTAFVLAGEDPVAAAKAISDFQKEQETFTIKAGLVEGRLVTADEVKRLATLPSREELYGQLGGALQAPLQGLVGAMAGLFNQFVGAVEALRAQRATT